MKTTIGFKNHPGSKYYNLSLVSVF